MGKCQDPLKEKERIRKMSLALKGRPKPPGFGEKIRKINIGRKSKIPRSELSKERQRERMTGKNNPQYGKNISEAHKQAVRKAQKGRKRPERTYEHRMKLCERGIGGFWYGNVRYYETIKYCELYDEYFRERVRAYWNYQCFECGDPQRDIKLSTHHIHYDKEMCCNGSPQDIIPLCQSCHSKTLLNRDYWEEYFTELLYLYHPQGKCFFTKEEMSRYLKSKNIALSS